MLLLTESLTRTTVIVSLAWIKALLIQSLIWSGLKLVGGVMGLRMRVLSGSGVGSGCFFEVLVAVEVVGEAACSTMLAQDFFAGSGSKVVVVGAVSWLSLVRI